MKSPIKSAPPHQYPRSTVAAVVEQQRHYLMVEEKGDSTTVFNQPAGHVEPGEDFEQAIIRETLEETSYPLTPDYLIGLYIYQHPDSGQTFHRLAYYGLVDEPLNTRLDSDIVAVHWLTLEEITQLEQENRLRSPLVTRCIRDYLSGEQYHLNLCKSLLENSDI